MARAQPYQQYVSTNGDGELHYHACTVNHHNARPKLQRSVIQGMYEAGLNQSQIAEIYKVSQSRISQILDIKKLRSEEHGDRDNALA